METYGIRTKVLFVLVMARCIGILDLIKLWMYSICPGDWGGRCWTSTAISNFGSLQIFSQSLTLNLEFYVQYTC